MNILFCNSNDKTYQRMLNELLKPIFLDFQFWYDLDLWDEKYESYSIIEHNEIVSNICVFKTQIQVNNNVSNALSLGAVATKDKYRGRGYSRTIMEHIIKKYDDIPMYLFANEDVVNFYPKFGFRRIKEKLPIIYTKIDNDEQPHILPFNHPKVWDYVSKRKNFSNKLDCLNTASINLFHIHWGYLKECIYELPSMHTMVIAKKEGSTLKLSGVFAEKDVSFAEITKCLPFQNVDKIEFGFVPDMLNTDYDFEECEDELLFVKNVACDLGGFKFPELSIT